MNYSDWFTKAHPSLIPPQDCKSIFPPKPPVPKPQTFLTTDEICGNFNIPCGSSNFTVWNTTEVAPSGTVSVFYSDGCTANLTVSVTDSSGFTDMFEVPPQSTISRTYSDLVMVRLTCPVGTGNNRCTGKCCLTIHYPVQV
ncbi:hypothetical protein SRABI80_02368 [Peribacillus frigoritolerans]|uniref:DUF3992 domain-containing protein n=1 Tax=Peribacillus frigoritolerans TaxID=450367 RepID=UPI001DAD74D3|nr:hypothetical protein SRABI80_02368 [Peribacillus frigoritolerans]